MARKMYREAIDAFRQGSPSDPVMWNKTGIAYHQMMQLDNAKKSYERAIKLKKDYVEAINNLGTVYYAKKSYRRAVNYYKKALKLAGGEPKSASIYMNLGTAYFARKKYDEATAAYQTAMKLIRRCSSATAITASCWRSAAYRTRQVPFLCRQAVCQGRTK